MPKIKVNGREIEVEPGKRLLEVLQAEGITVPFYCWHPGLKPHGNCRMCLVKVSNSRKLEVSCTYPVSEGLEVTTESPEIDAARKGVLEYMLINHPLDCPICDKAGECMLQDHTYNHRGGLSRFEEDKVIKGTWDLGPGVRIWGNRCIACTRCVRFLEDEVGTGELSIVNRGDHSVADTHPQVPLDNPMSLNVVDLCPVGALIDRKFMYQQRVWFAQRKSTICTSCSRGCNVTATTHQNGIKRLQPRENPEVNGFWMCDHGRWNLGMVTENRLVEPKGSVAGVARAIQDNPGAVGIIASTAHTLEELHLVRRLSQVTGAPVGFLTRVEGERWESKSGFVIETDKTPNTRGAAMLFGDAPPPYTEVIEAIQAGRIKVLVVLNQIADLDWPADLVAAAAQVPTVILADIQVSPLAQTAAHVIPVTCWAEKHGTYANRDGRIQLARAVIAPVPQARPGDKPGTQRHDPRVHDVAWLQEVLVALDARPRVISAEGVFREAFPGLDYARVGEQGVDYSVPLATPSPSHPAATP